MHDDLLNQDGKLEGLLQLIRTLRAPDGCPWDRAQTDRDLVKYLLSEAYEVADAVDEASPAHVREELGDLLFQILFLVVMAEERGEFEMSHVIREIMAKMIRRHPHVFGDTKVEGVADIKANWDEIKARVEKKIKTTSTLFDGISRSLPALSQAEEVTKRASTVGFDWESADQVLEKIEEEIGELRHAMQGGDPKALREEIGDLLFSVVNLSRFIHVTAEDALRGTIAKFIKRFTFVEKGLQTARKDLAGATLAEMDALWEASKQND
ncbi:MAG: tetrapyrrole methylase family protein / MazG family protein [Syntrophus sp. SKADARSKE-3]|nr:tetrapyrrole methylase family protein / MazG family protein [Syntrophus sp. SKADARSKE-3]